MEPWWEFEGEGEENTDGGGGGYPCGAAGGYVAGLERRGCGVLEGEEAVEPGGGEGEGEEEDEEGWCLKRLGGPKGPCATHTFVHVRILGVHFIGGYYVSRQLSFFILFFLVLSLLVFFLGIYRSRHTRTPTFYNYLWYCLRLSI